MLLTRIARATSTTQVMLMTCTARTVLHKHNPSDAHDVHCLGCLRTSTTQLMLLMRIARATSTTQVMLMTRTARTVLQKQNPADAHDAHCPSCPRTRTTHLMLIMPTAQVAFGQAQPKTWLPAKFGLSLHLWLGRCVLCRGLRLQSLAVLGV